MNGKNEFPAMSNLTSKKKKSLHLKQTSHKALFHSNRG